MELEFKLEFFVDFYGILEDFYFYLDILQEDFSDGVE